MDLISKKIQQAFQERISHEEANAKQYLAMSNWLNLNGFPNATKLWLKYAEDERQHKQWAVQFLLDLNILPIEPEQEQPETKFKSLPNVIALTMERELNTTEEVQELAGLCFGENDFMSFGLAQKYLAEQVEEISKVQQLIDQLNAFGDDKIALRLLDNWIGENLLG